MNLGKQESNQNTSKRVTFILLGDPQTGKSTFRNIFLQSLNKDFEYLLSHDEFSAGINDNSVLDRQQSRFYSSLKSVVRYHGIDVDIQTSSGPLHVGVEIRDSLGSPSFDNTKHLLFEHTVYSNHDNNFIPVNYNGFDSTGFGSNTPTHGHSNSHINFSNNNTNTSNNSHTHRHSNNNMYNMNQKRFQNDIAVVLLCFSFDQPSSFHNIKKKWIVKAQKSLSQHHWGNNCRIILVGLKDDQRIISLATGKSIHESITHRDAFDLAKSLNVNGYFEASIHRPLSIQNVFYTCIKMCIFPFETKILKKGSKKNLLLKLLDQSHSGPKGEGDIIVEFTDSSVASYKVSASNNLEIILSIDRNSENNCLLFYEVPDSWSHEFSIHGDIKAVNQDPQQMKEYQLQINTSVEKERPARHISHDRHSASTPNLDGAMYRARNMPPLPRKRSSTAFIMPHDPRNDHIIESLSASISQHEFENEKLKEENRLLHEELAEAKRRLQEIQNYQNEVEILKEENENLRDRVEELTELHIKFSEDKGRLEEQLKAQRKKIWKVNPNMIEFQDFLNRGSFGSVYKGKLNVAVKKISLGRNRKKMVLNEVGLMWEISHKNVLKCFGLAFENNSQGKATHAHILMELCQCNILEYFEKNPNMLLSEKLTMLLGIAKGLYRTHSQGIVHRDLKPENCLVDYSGEVKVSDFGSSKHQESISSTLCGTPSYLSPELYDNSVTDSIDPLAASMYSRNEASVGYGAKVDIYAFGIMMWQLLTMEVPYQDILDSSPGGYLQVLRIIHRSNPAKRPPLSRLVFPRGISDSALNDLKNLISRCWSVNPIDRPENFKAVGLELKKIRKQVRRNERSLYDPVEEPRLEVENNGVRRLKYITVLYNGKYIEVRDIQDDFLIDKIALAHFLLCEMGLIGTSNSEAHTLDEALEIYNLKFGNVDYDSFDLVEGLTHETLMVKIEKVLYR